LDLLAACKKRGQFFGNGFKDLWDYIDDTISKAKETTLDVLEVVFCYSFQKVVELNLNIDNSHPSKILLK